MYHVLNARVVICRHDLKVLGVSSLNFVHFSGENLILFLILGDYFFITWSG